MTEKVKRVVEEPAPRAVAPDAIYDLRPTSSRPARSGAIINDDTLKRLKVAVVAGGANNQLAEERHGVALEKQGHPLRARTT